MTAAPLWLWPAAGAVAAAVLGWLASADHLSDRFYVGRPNLARLDALRADERHVVALGSSKTLFGVPFDDVMSARLPGTRFHRVALFDPTLRDLTPALERLVARPPAVLLVEEDILLFPAHVYADRVSTWRHGARKNLRGLLGLPFVDDFDALGNVKAGDGAWLDQHCALLRGRDTLEVHARRVARARLATDAEREPYLVYLRRLAAAGTRLVLLHVPRSPAAEVQFPEELLSGAEALRRVLVEREGFEAWVGPALADDLFCDLAHLARAGRARYGDWLIGRLGQ